MMEVMFFGVALASEPLVYEGEWRVVTDQVMGGRTTATADAVEMGSLSFQGALSLDNGGGFGSTRIAIAPVKAASIKALDFLVRGDGRKYKMTLRSSTSGRRGLSFQQSFQTEAGKTIRVTLDMEQFLPRAYGRDQVNIPPLFLQDMAIDSVGVMLADKKMGPFDVHIQPISVTHFDVDPNKSVIPPLVVEAFELAIVNGVPMFNSGNVEGCAALYENTISGVLTQWDSALSITGSRRLRQTLNAAKSAATQEQKAWILRYGMDDALIREDL